MNVRRISLLLAAALVCGAWATTPSGWSQEAPLKRSLREAASPDPTPFAVFFLQHADAREVQDVLRNLFADRDRDRFSLVIPEMVIADPRTNSVVVRAPEEVLRQVEKVLESLDQPLKEPTQQVKVFTLQNTPADAVQHVLQTIAGQGVRIAVDSIGNRVIAQGDAGSLATIEALLLKLDESPPAPKKEQPPAQTKDTQVRVVWLVGGLENAQAAPPPPDLQNVVQELEKMGVTGLKTAAQVVVKAVEHVPFSVAGSAVLDQTAKLEVTGTLGPGGALPPGLRGRDDPAQQSAGPTTLEIAIRAQGVMAMPTSELANVQTTITAPMGHSVVLGVSPIGPLTSVFVVQVQQ